MKQHNELILEIHMAFKEFISSQKANLSLFSKSGYMDSLRVHRDIRRTNANKLIRMLENYLKVLDKLDKDDV